MWSILEGAILNVTGQILIGHQDILVCSIM
jgi:hypothetical protein